MSGQVLDFFVRLASRWLGIRFPNGFAMQNSVLGLTGGPQSAAEAGHWYARNMYIPSESQYQHHLEHYGHPSKFGFKDIIPTWKGDLFDPDHLVELYKRAGAKSFVSMGVHHDNFDLWNSKLRLPGWANLCCASDAVILRRFRSLLG